MQIGRDARSVKSLSRHTLEQMVSFCSEGILLADAKDPRLPVVYANPAYEDLSGYSVAELAGNSWQLWNRDGVGQPELAKLKEAIGRAEACHVTLPDVRKDGTSWTSSISVEPIYNARGELKYFLCIHRPAAAAGPRVAPGVERRVEPPAEPLEDATVDAAAADAAAAVHEDAENVEVKLLQHELGRAREKIATLNRIDSVTGLLRFDHFQELLQRDIRMARRDRRAVTLVLFEIVEFDAYRRTFGTKAADSCQRMIGAQITRTLRRAGDLCTRYDDSTLLAAVVGQAEEELRRLAEQIAGNVRKLGLHNPRAKSGRHITVRVAVVSCAPGGGEDVESVIARARTELHGTTGVDAAAAVAAAPAVTV
ncbi:MAG TPA: diguanylate cyclase [Gammaproteobacteria bacterium]|nr:diguanylate cyclase [Gammaproteobacteria bacterium]